MLPWYCWRASRPAAPRLAFRESRAFTRSASSRPVSARRRFSRSSVELNASVAFSASRYSR
nr:hypothetical protein [Streptomyces sp. MBT97]